MRVAIYARVSSERQEKEHTIGSQLEALRNYAAHNRMEIVEEFTDEGYSGARLDRPALDRMRDLAERRGFEVLLTYCTDRAEKSSGNTVQRTPLSKQRDKHLQTTLIEAAKMAPRNSPELGRLYDKEKQKGQANRATLAVARKLVAYLLAVDRGQRHFLVAETTQCLAA